MKRNRFEVEYNAQDVTLRVVAGKKDSIAFGLRSASTSMEFETQLWAGCPQYDPTISLRDRNVLFAQGSRLRSFQKSARIDGTNAGKFSFY